MMDRLPKYPLHELRDSPVYMDKVENLAVGPGTETTLADISGPGNIESIWMAVGGGTALSLDGRLRIYYGGEPAAIDVDLGNLLATHWNSTNGSLRTEHTHAEVLTSNSDTGFLLTFPMPFGTRIRITYFLPSAGVSGHIYSMVTYSYMSKDTGYRLKYQGARYRDQAVTRAASDVTTFASVTGSSGWIVFHSQTGGVGAANRSWMERNMAITVDGTQVIQATGTEDWFDSAWYYQGWNMYSTSRHSYVGTDMPAAQPQTVAMATDLLSKWGGVPFKTSVLFQALTEPACNTGDTLCWCILYYAEATD